MEKRSRWSGALPATVVEEFEPYLMKAFEYARRNPPRVPPTLLGRNGRYIAGGIDILGEIKDQLSRSKAAGEHQVAAGFARDQAGPQCWSIGANVTVAELAAHAECGRSFPGMAEAAAEVGSPQIRNVATLGGNLAQHSRCWYYRHPDVRCLKEGGSTCYAREGENKFHSLFTGNPCISPMPSNLAIALMALEATAHVQRAGKVVTMSMRDLYRKGVVESARAIIRSTPADLILHVEVPVRQTRSAYLQMARSTISTGPWSVAPRRRALNGKKLTGARVVLGQVAPVPYRSDDADKFLEGKIAR